MGKKARIKAQRLAESKGAKSLIEQIIALDAEIAQSEHEIANLQASKKAYMESVMVNENNPRFALAEFLTDAQGQAVVDILNRPNLDEIAQTKLLKQYLGQPQIRQQLSAKSMDHEYLAYMIMHQAENIRQAARATNEPHDEPHGDDPLGPMSRN
jgi:hypothetical protein